MLAPLAVGAGFVLLSICLDRCLYTLLHRRDTLPNVLTQEFAMSLLADLKTAAEAAVAKATADVASHVQSIKDFAAKAEADGAALVASHKGVLDAIEAQLAKVPVLSDAIELLEQVAASQAHT